MFDLDFRVSIRISGTSETIFQKITLSGRLKARGPLELGFEIAYERGRIEEIKLLAECAAGTKGMINLELLSSQKEGLGIQLTVFEKIFGDRSDLFLRARVTEHEKAVEGGVKVAW
ncbi:MAG: hypothetical protein HZC17_07100 [Candidatus Omnitrophica bacterium]|nr:hypothetical protein [Candidatus Omnitrophota bacterium]